MREVTPRVVILVTRARPPFTVLIDARTWRNVPQAVRGIGLMGYNAELRAALAVLIGLERVLRWQGVPIPRSAGVEAARKVSLDEIASPTVLSGEPEQGER